MERLGKDKNLNTKEVQLDLPFEDVSKNENTQHVEGEFQREYLDDHNKENDEEEITYLSPDELIELETSDPVAFKALMEKIKEREEQEKIDEIERAVYAEEAEKDKQEKMKELQESINRIIKENEVTDVIDERDDKTGGYRHTTEIALHKKEEEIKKKKELKINKNKTKPKSKKRWWNRGRRFIKGYFW